MVKEKTRNQMDGSWMDWQPTDSYTLVSGGFVTDVFTQKYYSNPINLSGRYLYEKPKNYFDIPYSVIYSL